MGKPSKEKPKFEDNIEDFKNTLSRIATLANKIDFQNFTNIFTKAYDMLDGKEIENYFYKKYFSLMPEKNVRLLVQQEFLMSLVEWVLGMIVLLGMHMKKVWKVIIKIFQVNF